eukprot:CAMPEP_0115155098 /NCGR_PEP_ID=MMETSP0227-20121206/67694_1 /TAXON_ID=89957 /ORGANISM="Polarella glacialis, Strain CCMP 1383" /LENGTH=91 /DNA_ID=CAMNT_0002566113 /DNA_START=51 /DNA_END=323 /DNA_ORIENTATION=-
MEDLLDQAEFLLEGDDPEPPSSFRTPPSPPPRSVGRGAGGGGGVGSGAEDTKKVLDLLDSKMNSVLETVQKCIDQKLQKLEDTMKFGLNRF